MNGADLQWIKDILKEIKDDGKETRAKVEEIVKNGCPMGTSHGGRISSLERWRTRGILGLIGLLFLLVLSLLGLK